MSRLLEQIVAAEPEGFRGVQAAQILVVAGAARRDARASIRPLRFPGGQSTSSDGRFDKPKVTVHGREMLYEICLRPRFFRATRPEARLATLVHELWHIGDHSDGALDPLRRHRTQGRFEAPVEELAERLVQRGFAEQLGPLAEATIAAWLVRPPSQIMRASKVRRHYDERDLYPAIIEVL